MDVMHSNPMSEYTPPEVHDAPEAPEEVDGGGGAEEDVSAPSTEPSDEADISDASEVETPQEGTEEPLLDGLGDNFSPPAEEQAAAGADGAAPAPSTADVATRPLQAVAQTGELAAEALSQGSGNLGRVSKLAGPAAGALGDAAALPGKVVDATDSVVKAFKTGDGNDAAKAVADSASAASTGTSLAKNALQVPEAIVKGKAEKAAADAFRKAAPNASKEVVEAAAKKAAESAIQDASRQVARGGTSGAAKTAARAGGSLAQGAGVGKEAAKQVLRQGGNAAATAARQAVTKGAMKTAAKTAGRFVPGANVAIAGLDTAAAAATLADKNASAGKKISSVVTAAGSIAAATNIPIVSQAGAVVSTLSSFIGGWF